MQTPIELFKAQLRWEPWKALAAMIAAAVVFAGLVLATSNYLHPADQQTPSIVIYLPSAAPGPTPAPTSAPAR